MTTLRKKRKYFTDEANASFAPIRKSQRATWFVDGKDTYEATITRIEAAQSHIYMSFWIFVATLYVRRADGLKDEKDRLDTILLKKAEEGIKIYILLWDESGAIVQNYSKWMKHYLEDLHANIVIVRHPQVTPIHWSHHQKFVVVDDCWAFVGGIDFATGRYDWYDHHVTDSLGETWWGMDFYAPLVEKASTFDDPDASVVKQTKHSRMPWHDIQMYVEGDLARDLADNFVQRWNHHIQLSKYKGKDKYPTLSLTPEDELHKLHPVEFGISPEVTPLFSSDFVQSAPVSLVDAQVVRSIGKWSGGTRMESSIYGAYLDLINEAQHFVYVENQFFVSGNAQGVMNQVSNAICDRISLAVKEGRKFRCIILTGQPEDIGPRVIPLIRFQYSTLCRGATSMMSTLKSRHPGIDLREYFHVFQLRNHGRVADGAVKEEQIFVHSKLLIVDDRTCVIASANLNDRSFAGPRDSELGIVVRGGEEVSSKMDGKSFKAVKFVRELRMSLFMEHLGFLRIISAFVFFSTTLYASDI
eukprot:TRINITY_DN2951_c0_g1_i2.p1 TRINITY_DN2951_c0_g1~~TRINITY_DN2951_c0_g1_i2.p1  ORF type:complete len:528 (-),score=79.17 TRINITY_DN2951_c0_g1_i2:406-1989(-)